VWIAKHSKVFSLFIHYGWIWAVRFHSTAGQHEGMVYSMFVSSLSLCSCYWRFDLGRGEKGRLRKRLRGVRTYEVSFSWCLSYPSLDIASGLEESRNYIRSISRVWGMEEGGRRFFLWLDAHPKGLLLWKADAAAVNSILGQAIAKDTSREKWCQGMLGRLRDLYSCKLCCRRVC